MTVEADPTSADAELSDEEFDRVFRNLSEACAAGDEADDDRLERALAESKRLAKEQVRIEMGLS